jgi:hypothetical protein
VTDYNGVVHLSCGDAAVDFAPCYADLPDLDGNGSMDDADCDLVGVGPALRAFCEAAPGIIPDCFARQTIPIADSAGTSITVTTSGGALAFAYVVDGSARIWLDEDYDGTFDPSEEREVFDATVISDFTSDQNGCMLLVSATADDPSAVDPFAPGALWRDTDCDNVVDSDEVATLAAPDDGAVAMGPRVGLWSTHLLVAFSEIVPGDWNSSRIRVWTDADDDLALDGGEVVAVGPDLPSTMIGAIHYASSSQLFFRAWDAGSYEMYRINVAVASASPDERVSGCTSGVESGPAYGGSNARLWACADGSSISVGIPVFEPGSSLPVRAPVGFLDLGVGQGTPFLSTVVWLAGENSVVLWNDINVDGFVAPTELVYRAIGLREAGAAGRTEDSMVFVFNEQNAAGDVLLLEERWSAGLFLGEECSLDDDPCVAELQCRISGAALEPHCVPAP